MRCHLAMFLINCKFKWEFTLVTLRTSNRAKKTVCVLSLWKFDFFFFVNWTEPCYSNDAGNRQQQYHWTNQFYQWQQINRLVYTPRYKMTEIKWRIFFIAFRLHLIEWTKSVSNHFDQKTKTFESAHQKSNQNFETDVRD